MDLGGYHRALFEVFYHSIARELNGETRIGDLLSVEVRSVSTPPLLNWSSTLDRSKTRANAQKSEVQEARVEEW